MTRRLGIAAAAALALAGCSSDKCKGEVPSVQLDVSFDASLVDRARLLRVEVISGATGWRRDFDLMATSDDGTTSLAIVVEPPPAADFELTIRAIALDSNGVELARAESGLHATADGCNRLALAVGG